MARPADTSGPQSSPGDPGLRRAEVVAALSLATDLGSGHPVERALRACLLRSTSATRWAWARMS